MTMSLITNFAPQKDQRDAPEDADLAQNYRNFFKVDVTKDHIP